MQPDYQSLKAAKEWMVEHFLKNPNSRIHSVGIGFIKEGGETTSRAGVIAKTENKISPLALALKGEPAVPREVYGVRIDVQQAPIPHDQRLRLDDKGVVPHSFFSAFGPTGTHRSCLQCPIPGGAQIAPNKPWVGTLAGALRFLPSPTATELLFGALTNAHVTGMNAEGQPMYQPVGGQGDPFGVVARVVDLHFNNQQQPNYIDAALINTLRTDGKYLEHARQKGWPGIHTVINEQIELGRIRPEPVQATLGMAVRKTGRTTGTTEGRVVEIDNSTYVAYDEGDAYFVDQIVIEGQQTFSAGGDSGSLILTTDNRPVGLLFAGGGGQTVANRIQRVLEWCKGSFY